MAIKIGSNIASLTAQRYLGQATDTLSSVFEQLSSGLRINKASDDAAGLSVASTLNASTREYTKALSDINDGASALAIAEGGLDSLATITTRVKELSEQSANGTYSNTQRFALNSEAQSLSNELTRVLTTTKFNGQNLIDGTFQNVGIQVGTSGNANFDQIGIGANDVLGQVGNGTFGTQITFGTGAGSTPESVTLADVNGDGKLDIVTWNENNVDISVLMGNGDGSYKAPEGIASGIAILAVSVADINGDGKPDLVASGWDGVSSIISTFLGNGDGTFSDFNVNSGYLNNDYTTSITLADLNGDGKPDVVVSTNNGLYTMMGQGDGTFQLSNGIPISGNSPQLTSLADLNGDGNLDIVASNGLGGLSVFLGNKDGTFSAEISYFNGAQSASNTTADINGDGRLDIITTTSNGIGILFGNGDGTFLAPSTISTGVGSTPTSVKVADLNGDGKFDIVTANQGSDNLSVLLGNGNGTFKTPISLSTGIGSFPYDISIGDMNGDGGLDIVSANIGTDNVSIFDANLRNQNYFLVNLTTQSGARSALDYSSSILDKISLARGAIGAQEERLQAALSNAQTNRDNYTASSSRIMDADIAEDSSTLIRTQILQQAAVGVLAQANQQPALALRLLKP